MSEPAELLTKTPQTKAEAVQMVADLQSWIRLSRSCVATVRLHNDGQIDATIETGEQTIHIAGVKDAK